MVDITIKQARVYDFIRRTIEQRRAPPTRAEIAQALGFSSANAAQAHLRTLERKGVITLATGRSRGIELTDPRSAIQTNDTVSLAVVGRVAAGAPILAVEHVERHCQIEASLFRARPDYLLRVTGESMRDAGILDGDLLAVRAATDVAQGQIAVLRWDDEVTVKRFYRHGTRVRLAAENPGYADIELDLARETVAVEGIAVGVIRTNGFGPSGREPTR